MLRRALTSAPFDAQMQRGRGQLASWGQQWDELPFASEVDTTAGSQYEFLSAERPSAKLHLQAGMRQRGLETSEARAESASPCGEHSACSSPLTDKHKAHSLGIKRLQEGVSEGWGRGAASV